MILNNFFNKKNLKKYGNLVAQIHEYETKLYHDLPLNEIANKIRSLKEETGIKDRSKVLHAMALARKASQHILGMAYYDVQLMGALALFDGCMAEMKTGEGKTLTCSAAVVANYVLNVKTHVATANEYLAQRDQQTLEPLYTFLGIKSSYCISSMEKPEKQYAYQADVVYSTAQELGFDFLRDNLATSHEQKMQPRDNKNVKAIIDEADFILIDEARTPLIISGEAPLQDMESYLKIRSIALELNKMAKAPEVSPLYADEIIPGDFWVDEKHKTTHLSEDGYSKVEKLAIEKGLIDTDKDTEYESFHLYKKEYSWIIHELLNALKAQYCYIKDKDYILDNGEIVIVDQNTGRLSKGRSWSNGLHQAIEAKENVKINPETMNIGSISIQNYFRNYSQISGMSGTIMQSNEEFVEIYGTQTIQIPTNRQMIRIDHNDRIYLSLTAKYKAIIADIKERHLKGQPILIGTTSVAESEIISKLLSENNIKHHVLNAKNHLWEAQIIAQAGQPFSVTVSTSMAGRGTDIILGGNKEALNNILLNQQQQIQERKAFFEVVISGLENQEEELQEVISSNELIGTEQSHVDHEDIHQHIINLYDVDYVNKIFTNGAQYVRHVIHVLEQSVDKQLKIIEDNHSKWREHVLNVGGLYVLGSSRNESRRIDNQLRGRAGRQGDPGESCFYLSIEDPWVNVFGKNPIFTRLAQSMPSDDVISAPIINRAFEKAQESIESFHFNSRKDTFQYDRVADEGRRAFIGVRNIVLDSAENVKDILKTKLLEIYTTLAKYDFQQYVNSMGLVENKLISENDFLQYIAELPYEQIKQMILKYEQESFIKEEGADKNELAYVVKKVDTIIEQDLPESFWKTLEEIAVGILDKRWSEHLVFIDEARQHVGFRSMAQKNPLYEFKGICYDSFHSLIIDFRYTLVDEFFSLLDLYKQEKISESSDQDVA